MRQKNVFYLTDIMVKTVQNYLLKTDESVYVC